jgi:hypothetical protein
MNVSKCVRAIAMIALLLLAGSCSPRYFQVHGLSETLERHLPQFTGLDEASSRHFAMVLRQRTFFKNNVEESVLITDHSQLVQGNLLYFSDTDTSPRGRRWHRVDAWVQSGGNGGTAALATGHRVVLSSSKGRLNAEGREEYELIRVMAGRVVGPVRDDPGLTRTLWRIHLQEAWQITGRGERQSLKALRDKHVDLEVLLAHAPGENPPEHLEVFTLIDRGQNQIGVEKAMIFDFRQIYGEPLWLLRQP